MTRGDCGATQRAIDLNNTNRIIPRSEFDKALQ